MFTSLKTRLAIFAMFLALVGVVAAGPLQAANAQPATGGTAQIFNTAGTLLGTVSNLTATSNGPHALPTISGTFTDTVGNITTFTTTLLGGASASSCTILDLTLGPLDLNVLGLMVHLDTVHLVITAQPGAGNLLGNLLCAVAHLLDNSGATGNAVTNLLNRIFALL